MIEINYAQSTSAAPGALVTQAQAAFIDEYHLASTAGYAVGDMVVANVGGTCTMSKTTAKDDATLTLAHAATNAYNPASSPSGAPAGTWGPALVNNLLVNLGTFVSRRYQISGDSLQLAAFPDAGTFNTVVEGILFMKAQYGLDTSGDGVVDSWVDGSTVITNTSQVLAMRMGVVARSPLYEKDPVDAPATLTVLPATTGGAAVTWNVPDAHYRYKAYYTVIPLRNVIWGRAT
jgi:type IV pilus assembly protein PilW